MAQVITDNNFHQTVSGAQVALVDFWAEWCGPCRMIGPIIEELSSEYAGRAVIGKLDVDNNPGASIEYGVRSIPTLLFFKNGKLVDRHVGTASKTALKSKLDALLA